MGATNYFRCYTVHMPKRSSKSDKDENWIAESIIEQATGGRGGKTDSKPAKNPAAVALGRLGGKKGGPARAKKLSAEERSEIARRAAKVRWASAEKEPAGADRTEEHPISD